MKILITGATGMLGAKLTRRLVDDPQLDGTRIDQLELVDVVAPVIPAEALCNTVASTADLSVAGVANTIIASRPDIVFHLAAVVSGQAEADYDIGYRVNLDGTRVLFEAIRAAHLADGYAPRVVFASSVAVFGAPFPERIGDDFATTPLTSYGTQKAMGELLLADATRRGFMDGVGLRLPTVCIRPGKPNAAASGFFSGILREPINGLRAVLPVSEDVRHWFVSPRSAVGFLMHAATLDGKAIGSRRNLNLPGLSATVAEQIDALSRVVGADALKLIDRVPDPVIAAIVSTWAEDFDTQRANALGFVAENSFDEILNVYLEDEMGQAG